MLRYCFDTSAFIECWTRSYPPDVFPGLWTRLNHAVAHAAIVTPDEVRAEIARQDDGLRDWLRERPHILVTLDAEVQTAVREVLKSFPLLVKAFSTRNQADPFVIATAKVHNLIIVTEERLGTAKKPRIPDVCRTMNIRCIDVMAFIREQGWTFS